MTTRLFRLLVDNPETCITYLSKPLLFLSEEWFPLSKSALILTEFQTVR